jgi:hypothetical protein
MRAAAVQAHAHAPVVGQAERHEPVTLVVGHDGMRCSEFVEHLLEAHRRSSVVVT